jgi:para-aminobenzoate synthetase component I
MTVSEFKEKMNRWGREKVPFLFIVDFEMAHPMIFKLSEINANEIIFSINDLTNVPNSSRASGTLSVKTSPEPLSEYKKKFDRVLGHLEYGDTFLTNLTISTEISVNASLRELFFQSEAKYKLLYKDQFLVFSPETFVKIKDGKIYSFPMKGTIDASIPDAKEKILADRKELAEHVTIVDLIRNDLSQVASRVNVTRFRYIDELRTSSKTLYQVSSEIRGELDEDYTNHLGDIMLKLLPAGSVSGAPKPKTLEIIKSVEGKSRGYYTGVFGYHDGSVLDSGVMIRFIEHNAGHYLYRSGGGITTQSVVESEYQEAIDKVYVPVA